jgi:hypothetical protein
MKHKPSLNPSTNASVGFQLVGQLLFPLAVALLAFILILPAVPRMFDGLWEDEIHYNFLTFRAPSLTALIWDTGILMRPLLEFVIRKYIWFGPLGFPISETNLALVAWLYGLIALLIIGIIPWSPYRSLRLLGVLLFGSGVVQRTYISEAQGYSFISLCSLAFCITFLAACDTYKIDQRRSLFLYMFGLFLALNSHYFGWPIFLLSIPIFGLVLWKGAPDAVARTAALKRLLISLSLLLAGVTLSNVKTLYLLVMRPPQQTGVAVTASFSNAASFLYQAWHWVSINEIFYVALTLMALLHPIRQRRWVSWWCAVSVFPIKLALIYFITVRSSYPIHDRYLIVFLGPYVLLALLGLESSAEWAARRLKLAGQIVALTAVALWSVNNRAILHQFISGSKDHLQRLLSAPANYSNDFKLFDTLKRIERPSLILTNHCWATDIPHFYMEYISPKSSQPTTVIQDAHCPNRELGWQSELSAYVRQAQPDWPVAIFYQQSGRNLPCEKPLDWQLKQSECVGLINFSEIYPWLTTRFSGPPLNFRGLKNEFIERRRIQVSINGTKDRRTISSFLNETLVVTV